MNRDRTLRYVTASRVVVLLLALALIAGFALGCSSQQSVSGDEALANAYEERQNDLYVSGEGTVVRILADDDDGSRHQRFIVALASGQTLLIAHNIDVAPRIPGLEEGDHVGFSGVYEWNDEGGVIHWTHRDPDGMHRAGWIEHEGQIYD